MAHKMQINGRRKALKSVLGASSAVAGSMALPDQWLKPVVSTVTVPSHAALTAPLQLDVSVDGGVVESDPGCTEVTNIGIEFASNIPDGTEYTMIFSGTGNGLENSTFEGAVGSEFALSGTEGSTFVGAITGGGLGGEFSSANTVENSGALGCAAGQTFDIEITFESGFPAQEIAFPIVESNT